MSHCGLQTYKHAPGFTIVELLVTVVLVSILATVAVPTIWMAQQRVKENELKRSLREIRSALDRYKAAVDEGRIERNAGESGYPRALESLVDGAIDLKDPQRRRIYFLRRLPRDPFASVELAASATWGKRSYASPPADPKEGADVFDIYSLQPGAALNGTPYRQW